MKIAMFAPYFTKPGSGFPNYFEYWQKSAASNSSIDFYIPTNVDISKYKKYENINFICMTDIEYWGKLEKLLGFSVPRTYYKTGEHRALYGILFENVIKEYDYWGTTEFDVIYGDILKFIQPYIDKKESVIGRYSPFRLIKNTEPLRYLPLKNLQEVSHPLNVDTAYSQSFCWYYDEISGMGLRYYQAGIKEIVLGPYMGEVDQKYKFLYCMGRRGKWGFSWNNGKLIGYNNLGEKTELMYIHLQKRKLNVDDNKEVADKFCIVPNRFINDCEIDKNITPNSIVYTLKNRMAFCKKMNRDLKSLDEESRLILNDISDYSVKIGLRKNKKVSLQKILNKLS